MEKRLRSSLQISAEEFLISATKSEFKCIKPSLKTLIFSIKPISDLSSSLPLSLHTSITQCIDSFKNSSPNSPKSPKSPPTKRPRRSSRSRNAKTEDETISGSSKNDTHLNKLRIYAHVLVLCVSHPKKCFSPVDLLPAVRELHDNMVIFESDSILSSEILNLCEEWWKLEFVGRETLISQSLPFLLARSLTLRKKVDVHRVYVLREAFSMFDFDDESIEDLKLLLIRCVITPLYLKTEEGRKFVAFMFGLSIQIVKEALALIKSQIPFGRKSMLEDYAYIVFRAWKRSESDSRERIENGFLLDLIEGAIHASTGAFAASIRRVLGGFISQRTIPGVEKLLFRLAEPVIFRSLQVANSNVRQNALHLLLDLFPLEDPESTKEAKDTLLDRQFFLLERLIVDDCPDVRVVAVEGSCRILHLFWEIIPSSTITKILTKIFDEMSHDISNDVRLSTLSGVSYLLGNPQSHEILKVLLPRLGHLIQDSALSVRAAVIDLLLLLRDVRTFQFNKVVGMDVLLAALANDQPLVAQKITRLLIPSYLPSKIPVKEACERCLMLIKRAPLAGARFCEFALSERASRKTIMELVKVLINLVVSPHELTSDQIQGALDAANHLCNDLVNESSCKEVLKELISGENQKCLLNAVAGCCSQSSLFNIVSTVSPDDVSLLLVECMDVISDCVGLSENVERQAEVRSAHRLMQSCNKFDVLFEILTTRLQRAAVGCHIHFGIEVPKQCVPSSNRKKKKSTVKHSGKRNREVAKKSKSKAASVIEEDYAVAVGIAWQIKELLMSEDTRSAMLQSANLALVFFSLKVITEVSILQCMCCDYMDTTPLMAYTALATQMTLQDVGLASTSDKSNVLNSGGSSMQASYQTALHQTLDHLLNCARQLFTHDSTESSNLHSKLKHTDVDFADSCMHKESQMDISGLSNTGSIFTQQKRRLKMVKMLSQVLMFIVDAATMRPPLHHAERCLDFGAETLQFLISILKQHSPDQLQFNEDDFRETLRCLKSAFTYLAKLLNIALKTSVEASPCPLKVYDLANNLLDLVSYAEIYLGSVDAARLMTALKPWLPDLILALGSAYTLRNISGQRDHFDVWERVKAQFPSWLSVLAKNELHELTLESLEEDVNGNAMTEEFPAFKGLMDMIVPLLRGNPYVLDAVGLIFMTGSLVGLERKDFGLVHGLLHFVCMKLVKNVYGEWRELSRMLASLQEIYPRVERVLEDMENNGEERRSLTTIRKLLEPVWMFYIYESEKDTMEED
ncbi:Condensin-2 complex subunit G2 [Dillenia turbinata]|uniref:Condensin-2 complex subunit G2 n=1 Tax=Dillenia turbinata TaxID=194707 RepID=A0AAN8UW72_9MAGN